MLWSPVERIIEDFVLRKPGPVHLRALHQVAAFGFLGCLLHTEEAWKSLSNLLPWVLFRQVRIAISKYTPKLAFLFLFSSPKIKISSPGVGSILSSLLKEKKKKKCVFCMYVCACKGKFSRNFWSWNWKPRGWMHVVCGPDGSEGGLEYGLGTGWVQGSAEVGLMWLTQGITFSSQRGDPG